MAEFQTKSLCKEIWQLKEMSIPHLNTMEWQVCMSGNTTSATPEVWAKAILTPMGARGLLAIWAQCPGWWRFASENFYENTMSLTQILFEELVLHLKKTLVKLQEIYMSSYTHLSDSSRTLGYLVRVGIIIELWYSRRLCLFFRRRCAAWGSWRWLRILDRNMCDSFPSLGLSGRDFK